jgi:flagellar biosynthesis/type III secretory pathway M-ring protein FliF/YscJ
MKSLRELVVAAAGINETRGDVLTLANLPFTIFDAPVGPPPGIPAPEEIVWLEWIKRNRYNLIAAAVVLLVLGVVFSLWNRRRMKRHALRLKREQAARLEQEQLEIAAAEEAKRLKAAEETKLLQGLRSTTMGSTKSQVLKKHLEGTAAKDPEGFVQLLRTWIHEDED